MEEDKDTVDRHTFALEETPCSRLRQMDAVQLVASHAGALSREWRLEGRVSMT